MNISKISLQNLSIKNPVKTSFKGLNSVEADKLELTPYAKQINMVKNSLLSIGISPQSVNDFLYSKANVDKYISMTAPSQNPNEKSLYDKIKEKSGIAITPNEAYFAITSGFSDEQTENIYPFLLADKMSFPEIKIYIENNLDEAFLKAGDIYSINLNELIKPSDFVKLMKSKSMIPEEAIFAVVKHLNSRQIDTYIQYINAEDLSDESYFEEGNYDFEAECALHPEKHLVNLYTSTRKDKNGELVSGLKRPLTLTEALSAEKVNMSQEQINFYIYLAQRAMQKGLSKYYTDNRQAFYTASDSDYKKSKEYQAYRLAADEHINSDVADIISVSEFYTKHKDKIKAMLYPNRQNVQSTSMPSRPISARTMVKILKNKTIKKHFLRYIDLISIDKETQNPIVNISRPLSLNEALYAVKYNLNNYQIDKYISYLQEGILLDEAAYQASYQY